MSEPKHKKDYTGCYLMALFLIFVGGSLFVGIVKFLAWWRVAFG